MVIPGQKGDQGADPEDGQHGGVLVVARTTAADGKHDRAQEAPGGAEDEKGCRFHVAEADDIGEGVLRKAGDQKEDEGDRNTPVLHEVIVLLDDLGVDNLFHERHSEPAGQQKSEPRADRKADRGVDRPQDGAVEIPPDEAVELARNRRDQDLDDLEADEDHNGERAEGVDKMDDFFPADEESVEVVIKEKENADEDQCKQERNFKDGISVHGSVTGLTVDLFSPGRTQRRDPSAPCPFAGTDSAYRLTKGSAIVKRDIFTEIFLDKQNKA